MVRVHLLRLERECGVTTVSPWVLDQVDFFWRVLMSSICSVLARFWCPASVLSTDALFCQCTKELVLSVTIWFPDGIGANRHVGSQYIIKIIALIKGINEHILCSFIFCLLCLQSNSFIILVWSNLNSIIR